MSMSRSQSSSGENILLYIIALFFPPIPRKLESGCGGDFIINICLWIFGWIPGVIHAWYIIATSPKIETVTYDPHAMPATHPRTY
ncbi:hypothetical protein BKA70DRAFT_1437226 [Coprinopsis sp. MPI-PUGE-AT-0042]|nr:hypothetical protein BKA70DRAFT_1437226 [Coprinopsis sp. MPI-PUGE-AT-0042]